MKTALMILTCTILTLITTASGNAKPEGWLGVSVQDMTPRLARSMHAETREGALVNDVIDDSPADSANLKNEDIIVEFNKKQIEDANDLIQAVRKTAPGTLVNVVVMRNGDKKSIEVRLGKLPHSERNYSYSFEAPRMPAIPRTRVFSEHYMLGLSLSELNEQLGEYFEAPDGKGVLVQEVEKGSEGDKAGFKAGDVITKAGKESVEDPGDVSSAIAEAEKGDKVDFEIIRKGGKKILTVEVEDSPSIHRFHFNRRPRSDIFFKDSNVLHGKPNMENLRLELDRMGRELRNHLLDLRDTIRSKVTALFS